MRRFLKNILLISILSLAISSPAFGGGEGKVVHCPIREFTCLCTNMMGTAFASDTMALSCNYEVCVESPPARSTSSIKTGDLSIPYILMRDKFAVTCENFCAEYLKNHGIQTSYWDPSVKLGPDPMVCEGTVTPCTPGTFSMKPLSSCAKH